MQAFLSHASADEPLVGAVQKILIVKNALYDAMDIESGDYNPSKEYLLYRR